MGLIAYELREDYAGTVVQRETEDDEGVEVPTFTGGLIRVGTDREADVAELLEARDDRVIVIDDEDPALVTALDEYPPLKRTVVPDGAIAINAAAKYDDLKVGELKAEATARGIEGSSSAVKADLVTALEEHDRRLADGGLDELGAPLTVAALLTAAAGEPAPTNDTGEGA